MSIVEEAEETLPTLPPACPSERPPAKPCPPLSSSLPSIVFGRRSPDDLFPWSSKFSFNPSMQRVALAFLVLLLGRQAVA